MNWLGQKVLVTGAGGFIGSHLTEELVRQGARVRVLLRYNSRNDHGLIAELPMEVQHALDVRFGDIRDAECVSQCVDEMEVVFHLAALISIPYSYVNPSDYVAVNLAGTTNVLNACRRHHVKRLVHTSTSEVYGTALSVLIREDHPLQPQSPYSASKIGADAMAMSYFHSFDLPVSIIRPFNTYGPRQSMRAVIPTIALQTLCSQRVRLGLLDSTRDFNFVSDTVAGFLRVAESESALGQAINVGSGHEISIRELARRIGRLLGKEPQIELEERRLRPTGSEVLRLCADNARARELTGWVPKVSLDEGLVQTLEWWRGRLVRDPTAYVV